MPSTIRPEQWLGAVLGCLTALSGVALSGTFLWLVGDGPLGTLEPFTALTVDGVGPTTAATWLYFDVLGVAPTVQWDNVTVIRGTLEMLTVHGYGSGYSALWVVPPATLVLAGGFTVGLARRLGAGEALSATSPDAVTPAAGAYVALGYTPTMLVALWAATVPVAPDASGPVRIGATVTDAADVAGVTAGPTPLFAVLAAVTYPLLFGLLGGMLAGLVDTEDS